ncbi:MAG: hypothetical protein H7X99_08430, partial [Saprospiraceae bacterium]|nr:hypothetical protein [Saprospiraceae bacterium]
ENGIQDLDEVGLNGILIKLYNEEGLLLDSTISNILILEGISGHYSFTGLPYGNYYLEFSLPNNFDFTVSDVSQPEVNSDVISMNNGQTDIFTILPNQKKTDIDAGYIVMTPVAGNIKGRVWQDANNNKIRDASEQSLSGIEVRLYKIDGNIVAATNSGLDGTYSFSDIPFGDYYITVPEMSDKLFVLFGGQSVPFDSDITNDFESGSSRILNLFPGETLEDIDAGYTQKISIGDFVWEDINDNGLQDIDEPGISGIDILLINEQGNIEKSTLSTQNGAYIFENVPVGRYTISFGHLEGYFFTDQNVGDPNLNSKADENGIIPLTDFLLSQVYTNMDVGYIKSGEVGDNVWLDLNGNGFKQNGEPGIANIKVILFEESGILKDSTLTMVDTAGIFSGYYQFKNVRPGNYFIRFEIPSELIVSPPGIGGEDNDSNITHANGTNTTDIFTVSVGEIISNIDAGAFQPATLGDRVWDDINMNGVQDAGEPGVAGVTVSLFTQSGQFLQNTMTDVNGIYAFTGLRQRLYYLQFSIPDGFQFTQQYNSGDGATDSDVDGTGTTALISLAHGSTFLDLDAGIHLTTARLIMGNVWNDSNEDGIRTYNEQLMPLIHVYLKDANQNVVGSTMTNHAGIYSFACENTGEHFVFVETVGDYVFTTKGVGSNPYMDSDVNSDGTSDMLMLDDNYEMEYVDAGYYLKVSASINGVVWLDENNSGFRDPSEHLLPNVLVLVFNKFNIFIK